MPLLIDTYNVLHTTGVLPPELAGTDVLHLIRLLKSSRYRDERTILVCDGAPESVRGGQPINHVGPVTVRYSGKGKLADDLIAQYIKASTAPRRLVVVSSDHEVIRSARKRRCRTMTSEELLAELAADALADRPGSHVTIRKPPGGMSEVQVDKWINAFNLDEETLAIAGGPEQQPVSAIPTQPLDVSSPLEDEQIAPPVAIKNLRRGEGLPVNLIEQAERMWQQQNQADVSANPEQKPE